MYNIMTKLWIRYMKNQIEILGAYGAKTNKTNLTCFKISDDILIDGGNIIQALDTKLDSINHIFLTHSHLDHILDIPFLIENSFENRKTPLNIYGTKETITTLKKHIFNWQIWPDFGNIHLINDNINSLVFHEIEYNTTITINNVQLKPIKNNHIAGSCGYVITKQNYSILLTSDTGICDNIWNEVNQNKNIKGIIVEISFPSRLNKLAIQSKHLTPELLNQELLKLKKDDIVVFINHIKPNFKQEIQKKVKIKLKWKSHPHNAFLTVAVLHGLPALVALLLIFIQIYCKLFKYKENFYSIVGISFITLYLMEGLTENNFGDSEVKMFFWFMMGIILVQCSNFKVQS